MDLPLIYGFNECSEMGNDIFAPSVFLAGCNLRCPYCMNSKLVEVVEEDKKLVNLDDVISHIKENNIKWVNISGGEPTCNDSSLLRNLLDLFISMGCKIGMSTNGSNFAVLQDLIQYLNYVALDIKSGNRKDYESISDRKDVYDNVICSRFFLSKNKIDRKDFDYEVRTTLYPPFVDIDCLRKIGEIISRDDMWVFQQFRHTSSMLSKEAQQVNPYTENEIFNLLNIAKEFTSNVQLKYV